MSATTIKTALLQAVDEFRSTGGLSKDELQNFEFSKLEDVQAALLDLQHRQAQTKRLRYMKRLEPFLETMKEYGKVIEVFVNSSELLAFVWGPMKYVLLIASTYSEAFSSMLKVYEIIGEQIPLLSSYQSLFNDKPFMRTLLVLIFQDILEFHKEALRFFKQKLWRQLFQATWKGFLLKVNELKDNLRRHHHLIENRATLEQFEVIQTIRRSAEATFKEQQEATLSRQRRAVLQWLAPVAIEAIHERHVRARADSPNAGQWLLDDQRFQNWFHPLFCSTPLLWLNGNPGTGKTVLASRVIEEGKEKQDFSLAFFYCAEHDPDRNTFISVARGILAQLLTQDNAILAHMHEKMLKSGEVNLSSPLLAKDLLQVALKSRKSYIILDGIDECSSRDQRKEICVFFRNLVDSLPRTKMDEIRCLFVSQDDGIARKDLSMLPTIKVGVENNRLDIEAFAKHCQSLIEGHFGAFTQEELDIAQVVTTRSLGMFIFARCVCEELFRQPSRQSLLDEWRSDVFPEDLDQLYRRILKRVLESGSRSQRQTTRRLLGWISCSRRPLRWCEIQSAISIDLDSQRINDEARRLISDSKDLCASLVELYSDQRVELVHPTVKEFLLREKVVIPFNVNQELASLSISYLCFPTISSKISTSAMELSVISGQYGFYDYAVANWVSHLLAWLPEAKHNDIEEIGEGMEAFLDQHYIEIAKSQIVSKTMETALKPLECLDTYPSAAQAIIWARKLMLSDTRGNGPDSNVLDFPTLTTNYRAVMEQAFELGQPDQLQRLEKYYGTDFFKCSRVYCPRFYRGFPKRDDRDKHNNRHDRAHTCSFEGCPTATLGCVSKADLDKHMLEYHGLRDDDDNKDEEFPTVADPQTQRVPKHPATFQCTLCPKRFTRAYNLRSHLRMHIDERPFTCTVCGKSFARQHDRKRHEGLHSGEKQFVCRGDLETGGQWGCGKRFARADSLGSHFRSEAGRICIKPLLDEEMVRRQRVWMEMKAAQIDPHMISGTLMSPGGVGVRSIPSQEQDLIGRGGFSDPADNDPGWGLIPSSNQSMENGGSDGYDLPAALLAQHPALAQMNWSGTDEQQQEQ